MTDETRPKIRRADDPLMTTIDRVGLGGTVIALRPRTTASLREMRDFHVSRPTDVVGNGENLLLVFPRAVFVLGVGYRVDKAGGLHKPSQPAGTDLLWT